MIVYVIGACFSFAQQIYNTYKIEQYYKDYRKKLEYDYKIRYGKEL